MALVAAQSGGVLNAARLASTLGISAYATGATARAVGAPKITLVDSGIAAWLTSGLASSGVEGCLLEAFVLGELGRQLSWSQVDARLYHYRDRDGYEVDAILEDVSGRVIAIEVKASETLRSDDVRGLRKLQDRLGERFLAGFVLNCGDQSLNVGRGLACLPISSLWTTSATF